MSFSEWIISCTGPGCSKLTTSLVDETLISQRCQYFLLKKYEKLLHGLMSSLS